MTTYKTFKSDTTHNAYYYGEYKRKQRVKEDRVATLKVFASLVAILAFLFVLFTQI